MELNKEQLIKAMKHCCGEVKGLCKDCLLRDDSSCTELICEYSLSLIKELTEENEGMANICNANDTLISKLQEESKKLTINMNAYGLTAKNLGEENERLRAENERLHASCMELAQKCASLTKENAVLKHIELEAMRGVANNYKELYKKCSEENERLKQKKDE